MNRRDFFKWASRLLAAIPFVVLADLETKPTKVPLKLVPADESIYTTATGETYISTEWGVSPTFQFWHEGTILWGSANNDDLSLKPVWVSPYKNST